MRVFLGGGDGRFAPAPGSPFPALLGGRPHNHGLTTGDVNGDGAPDMVTSNKNDHSLSVLLGNGRGQFTPAAGSPFPAGRAPYPHALEDVSGDGHLDAVVPNVGGNTVTVLLGDGKGGFSPAPGSPYAAGRGWGVSLGDVNGDRRPDIATADSDGNAVSVLLSAATGGRQESP